ncbi:DUF6042 family protein [Micromonospora sp. NPDC049107]|uniref:DUF6042 family protein n=1 Tax=unclassified Micromonospora TaxID=2617518 RepID=UPI0033E6A5A0
MYSLTVQETKVVVLAEGSSSSDLANARGHLFEYFIARLLTRFGFEEPRRENINVTSSGIELDVVLRHGKTGRTVLVECKAYGSPVPAKELVAFYGKVHARRLAEPETEGLLFALPGLSRSGAEQARTIQAKDSLFAYFDADRTADIARQLHMIEPLPAPLRDRMLTDPALVITEYGVFSARVVLDTDTRQGTEIVVWGTAPVPAKVLELVAEDAYARGLPVSPYRTPPDAQPVGVAADLPVLVEVRGSDTGLDYRLPAAAEFFVGRRQLIDQIMGKVGTASSIVIHGKSGWGKSSVALRLKTEIERHGGYAAVFDTRTAGRSGYAAAALGWFVEQAAAAGHVTLGDDRSWNGVANAVKSAGNATWHTPKRPLLLFFDQFEAVLTDELASRDFRDLVLAIAGTDVPLTLGFAWRTDMGEWFDDLAHPVRHQILATSAVFTLETWTDDEIDDALARLDAGLPPGTKAKLRTYCQGLPWLLKKLAEHVADQRRDMLAHQQFDVAALFDKDLSGLRPVERHTLEKVAAVAPVSIAEAAEMVPAAVIDSLIAARLLVEIGGRLDTYWDTFREYLISGRLPEEVRSDVAHWRREWQLSGWQRLLPHDAMFVEIAVATATVLEIDGSLADLLDHLGVVRAGVLPEGTQTPLDWGISDDNDEETNLLKAHSRESFRSALSALDIREPATIGELADTLAAIGVYHRSVEDGVERWRCEDDLPPVAQVLTLTDQFVHDEERVALLTRIRPAVDHLLRHLRGRGCPEVVVTSVQRLADEASMGGPAVRDALAGMIRDGDTRVQRFMKDVDPADLERIAEHARITLLLDWSRDAGEADHEDDDWDDIDLQHLRWSGPPWQVYQSLAEQFRQDDGDVIAVLGALPFAVRFPNGNRIFYSMAQAAVEQRISVPAAAGALLELARNGLLIWNHEVQEVQFRESEDPAVSSFFEIAPRR